MAVRSIEQNVNRYPLFRILSDGLGWIPVFFLYLSQTLPLEQIIALSAIYYLSVFVLEVPSGYFSDRIGRRTTLLIAAAALSTSYLCFIFGTGFTWFAVAQFFLAMGIAMQSGTDSAFLYDSLKALNRESEYQFFEARAEQYGMTMLAVACLCGGLLGQIDLRLAYVFSLLCAVAMFSVAWQFVEPAHESEPHTASDRFLITVGKCLARLRNPVLLWLFGYSIVLYALAHVVYEFYQPYITLLDLPGLGAAELAPALSGITIAISMFGGALGARVSTELQTHLGLGGLLMLGLAIQLGIVGAMAVSISNLILILICARNFPMALVHAPIRAAIAPRISTSQRATYLSLQGLSERLFFAGLLFLLSTGLDRQAKIDAPTLLALMETTTWIGLAASVIALLFIRIPSRAHT